MGRREKKRKWKERKKVCGHLLKKEKIGENLWVI
jgi:hypothetical protein